MIWNVATQRGRELPWSMSDFKPGDKGSNALFPQVFSWV